MLSSVYSYTFQLPEAEELSELKVLFCCLIASGNPSDPLMSRSANSCETYST